jgi:hypothetical protein
VKHYLFKVTLSGYGKTLQEAWDDAIESFTQDSGAPDDEEYTVEEDDPQLPESISQDGSIAKE